MSLRKRVKSRLNPKNFFQKSVGSAGDWLHRAGQQGKEGYRRYKDEIITYGPAVLGAIIGTLINPGAGTYAGFQAGAAVGGAAAGTRKHQQQREAVHDEKRMIAAQEAADLSAAPPPKRRKNLFRSGGDATVNFSSDQDAGGGLYEKVA